MKEIRFPKWVPHWAISEYDSLRGETSMQKLINAPEMQRAWRALDKHEQALRNSGAIEEPVNDPEKYEAYLDRSTTCPFFSISLIADGGEAGLKGWGKYTKAEVNDRADDIVKLAKRLASKLEHIVEGGQFCSLFESMGRAILPVLMQSELRSKDDPNEIEVYLTSHAIALSLPELLRALAIEAANIRSRDAVIARPHHPHAARLYVLRKLRKYFENRYGKPLHPVNLAVTSVFYDCSNLTPIKVATLTTTAKRTKKS